MKVENCLKFRTTFVGFMTCSLLNPQGVFPYQEVGRGGGGLDLTSSLEAKFGSRSRQVHHIRGKIWEFLSPQDTKVGVNSQFWDHI